MILGQLLGGALGDTPWLGRLGALRLVMSLQIVASLASAFCGSGASMTAASSSSSHIPAHSLFVQLAVWRFLLGVGAGGVYPLAAVLSAEQTDDSGPGQSEESSLQRVVLTFSTQGIGFLAVPLVTVFLLHTFADLDLVWRILLALGSLPGLCLSVLQWHIYRQSQRPVPLAHEALPISETAADEHPDGLTVTEGPVVVINPKSGAAEEEGHFLQSSISSPRVPLEAGESYDTQFSTALPSRNGIWSSIRQEDQLLRKLFGTACTWFLFDVLFYGNTLFQPIVIEAAFGARDDSDPLRLLQQTAFNSLLLTSMALPGYFMASMVLGNKTCGITQTPRYVMLQGFLAMSLLYLTIGVTWTALRRFPSGLIILYGLTFFFANYGPNTTTFVLPSLVYSPECRSTLNGVSAAAGKIGALVGASLFAPAAGRVGDATIMVICSVMALMAFAITYLFVQVRRDDGNVA